MKAFIIYNEQNPGSKLGAEDCLQSFGAFSGWEPEMFNGCWKTDIAKFQEQYGIYEGARTKHVGNGDTAKRKYGCFYSHFALWSKCADLGEPIAILEYDTRCASDFNVDFDFDQRAAIQLTTESLIDPANHTGNNPFSRNGSNLLKYKSIGPGVHKIFYKHPHGTHTMAGNTGYIMTPKSAEYLIQDCKENGWTQNDILIDYKVIDLYYVNPSPIKWFREKEMHSSTR